VWQDATIQYFLFQFFHAWNDFIHRFGEKPRYFYERHTEIIHAIEGYILVMDDMPDISRDFFEAFRRDFLVSIVENTLLNKVILLNYLHL